jgi:hypothetical protein
MGWKRRLGWGIGLLVLVGGVAQLVPYGRAYTNPPVRREAPWQDPSIRELAVRACYDCHSNQTVWPWYARLAPASWLIQRDVVEGRRELNFSEWDRPQREVRRAARKIQEGDMPPWFYVLLHPRARLSEAERQTLMGSLHAIGSQGL